MPLMKQRGFKGLKFSILCDVFLLFFVALFALGAKGQTIEIVPSVFSEDDLVLKPLSGSSDTGRNDSDHPELANRFDIYGDFSKTPHDTIQRILRDEDSALGVEDQRGTFRWKKSAESPVHRKVSKREIEILLPSNSSSSENSTKSLDLVNSNLTKFVIDSDLELQLKQSDDRRLIMRLNLTNNLIKEFSTEDLNPWLAEVTHLDLTNNRLSKFVVNVHSQLVNVNLSGNNISSLIIAANDSKLETLSIQNSNLSSVSVTGNTSIFNIAPAELLETLDLSCNEITKVDEKLLGSGRALKRLNLSKNRLRRIEKDTFYTLINIDTLVLSHNQIESIDAETFSVLPTLQYLDLSYNNIRAESIRSLQGIPDLVGLSIAYNPDLGDALQEFVASWSLKDLDASGTGLCRIPSALAQAVRTLVLVDNWFEVIRCGDLDSYPLLQYLDLSHSHIAEIEDDALGRLEILQTLFLDHNRLKRIPISLPTNLENLFLHNNEITDIQPQSLQQLTNLRTLDLSHNKLTYLPGLPLPKLLVLNLQSSGLRGLSQSVVKTSPKLRDLLLDGNPIKCTELMGIAEWASPCQNRDTITTRTIPSIGDKANQQGIKEAFIEMHNYLTGFPAAWQRCPRTYAKGNSSYGSPPACATLKKDLLLQSNKLETQFNKTIVEEHKSMKEIVSDSAISPNHSNEDIENSIQVKPPVLQLSQISDNKRRQKHQNESSKNSKGPTSHISGEIASSLASNQTSQAELLPNDTTTRIDDRPIKIVDNNSSSSSINGSSNQRGNKMNGRMPEDAKSSPLLSVESPTTATISSSTELESQSQLHHNFSESGIMFTKFSNENIRQKQQQSPREDDGARNMESDKDTASTLLTFDTTTTLISFPITTENNGLLNTNQPEHQQISTNSRLDKLDQTSTHIPSSTEAASTQLDDELLPTTTTTVPINDSVSDEMKTTRQTKMMMLAIQPMEDDIVQEPTRKVSRTASPVQQQDISNDETIYRVSASYSVDIASGKTPSHTTTTTESTKATLHLGRIASKMLSSKVNKADKVVDHHQLSPSAINENGIIKRNQNSSSYYGQNRALPETEGVVILAGRANDSEKRIRWPQSPKASSTSAMEATNKGSQHPYQDVSQQNQQTTTAAPTTSRTLASNVTSPGELLKKKIPHLPDKMRDDKHLRFVGAKNLNLTVLTYNGKGHTHKTINKDIAPQPHHPMDTTLSREQLFSDLGSVSQRVPSIDFQSTTPAPLQLSSSTNGQSHVKVNQKRIANESNNHQNNNHHQDGQDEADLRPQLNALHALASVRLNLSNNATSDSGLPPERWLDIRTATGHPGLLVVIGLTIGVIFTLGLIHIYRCRRPVPWRRASHLHHLHDNLHSPHCCNSTGQEGGNSGNLHEYSPGHFCSYSYNSTDDDAGYYIEPDQNRIRTSARRDFLPMELLRSTANADCRESRGTNARHHYPESHVHSIW